ncbi:hypothetical protein ACTA71_009614 [Dictyostelium dimigraforme]
MVIFLFKQCIEIQYCLPSHHEGNGIAERYTRTVTLFFRRMVTGENLDQVNSFGYNDLNTNFLKRSWLKYVDELQFLLNSSNKFAPAEIVFEFAKSNLLNFLTKMENYGNKKCLIHNFQVGDKIIVGSNSQKPGETQARSEVFWFPHHH